MTRKALINNAGFGDFGFMGNHDIQKMVKMIDLNVTALAILSSLFVRDYKCKQTQLINISSVGGYFLAPGVVPYCGTKFFVSAFTEGLYHKLAQDTDANMQAKILAPAATKSEFCDVASGKNGFDYDASFEKYHRPSSRRSCTINVSALAAASAGSSPANAAAGKASGTASCPPAGASASCAGFVSTKSCSSPPLYRARPPRARSRAMAGARIFTRRLFRSVSRALCSSQFDGTVIHKLTTLKGIK